MAATGDLPMATSALSPLPHNNSNCVDPTDIDYYINYEQSYLSPSPSSSSSSSSSHGKTTVGQPQSQPLPSSTGSTPSFHPSTSAFDPSTQSSQQQQQVIYSAPSHQYDSYKQQTGLPMGGLADTMANNRAMGLNYGYPLGFQPVGVMMPTTDYMYPQRCQNPLGDMDMDLEGDMGMQGLPGDTFLGQSVPKTEFVDPSALGGHEPSPVVAPANQMGRVYPGIHQQQAARARAAQLQRQQELIRRQQQQRQQQQQQQQQQLQQQQSMSAQQPQQQQQQQQLSPEQQNTQPPQQQQPQKPQDQPQPGHSRQGSRSQTKPARATDPLVEERISRILQQMRQSCAAAAAESIPPPKPLPQITKPKKLEEEMDEDERLLASEEGKKLSSKERRQLRNKVSARAFRSRRKEYIGQLEGEVTAKTNEANDLRLQNRALMEENARLTDLTRMLLSSKHFAAFLDDISVNGLPPPSTNPQSLLPTPPQPQLPTDGSQDVQMPTPPNGMATVPEQQSFDFAALDVNGPGWNSGIDTNYNPPVFAILDVPEPPIEIIESSILSGKDSFSVGPLPTDEPKDVPCIERPPVTEPQTQEKPPTVAPDDDLDENDPAFALFLDQQPTRRTEHDYSRELFGHIPPEKVFARFDLVVGEENGSEPPDISVATMMRFERLCASIEGPYQRLCRLTAHLD